MKAAIFDVDGTLLDSMSVWEDIGERYLASQNITAEKNLRAALHTMSLEQGAAWMKEKYQLDKSISQIIEEVLKIVSDFYRFEAPLKPGVKKTLEWFKERNIQMTVATSGNRELTEAALARNGILDYFEQIYTCTETGAGKDEPLIYLKAAESMQAEPNETLVFEDALHAAETAKKAGFVRGLFRFAIHWKLLLTIFMYDHRGFFRVSIRQESVYVRYCFCCTGELRKASEQVNQV